MLSKLLKYEFRYAGRIIPLLYAGLAVLAILCRGLWDLTAYLDAEMLSVPFAMALLLFILAACATLCLPYILSIVRFFKNMVGDEGYLTFTLPVPPAYHILSKLICSLCYMILSFLAVLVCVGILVISPDNMERLQELWMQIQSFLALTDMGDSALLFVIEAGGLYILGSLSGLSMLYAAMSVGQLMKGHKIVGSVLSYLGLNFICQTVSGFVTAAVMLTPMIENLSGAVTDGLALQMQMGNISMILSMILSLIYTVGFFFLTDFMLTKKLNLD